MILALANQKGGVGKTTATFNLAEAISHQNKKVLIIDNDPQFNLTQHATRSVADDVTTIDELYLSNGTIQFNFHPLNENLDLLPANQDLSGVEYYLVSKTGRESQLKERLSPLQKIYDYILIDNPPSLNLLTLNGLVASERVLIPVQPEYFSLEGIRQIQTSINDLKRWYSHLEIGGIFLNMYDDRRKLNAEVRSLLRETFGELLLETIIHDSVKIPESSGYAKSVLEYAPSSRSSKEFIQLAQEITRNLESA